MFISVVVPIFNTEQYLNECIDSLLNQSYDDYEIILVDDGSTDASSRICDSYAINPLVKVFHQSNRGRTKARIYGVEQAKGEFVCFVDADDYVAPTYIEQLAFYIKEQKVDISVCQCYKLFGKHSFPFQRTEIGYFEKEGVKKIISSNILYDDRSGVSSIGLYLCCKMVRRDALLQVLPLSQKLWYGEDVVSSFLLMMRSKSIYVAKEPLYYYRQYEGQTTNIMNRKRWDANILLFNKLTQIDTNNLLSTQLPLYILSHLREWLKNRIIEFPNYKDFKADMSYALKSETMERLYLQAPILTRNWRYRILAFLSQHKYYLLYYLFLKVHLLLIKHQRQFATLKK